MNEQTTSEPQQPAPDSEQRVTYLDVVEQQLVASIAQAQATIASCESALTTVRLLRAQLDSARKIADERRREAQQQDAPKKPATFGSHRRAGASSPTTSQEP